MQKGGGFLGVPSPTRAIRAINLNANCELYEHEYAIFQRRRIRRFLATARAADSCLVPATESLRV